MCWPDYHPPQEAAGMAIGPTLILGPIFGALFGVLASSQLLAWWGWSPGDDHAPSESLTSAPASTADVEKAIAPTPVPTIVAQSQNDPALAPDFELLDLFDEALIRSLSGFSGRPVIFNFWASWFIPSKEEMPTL